MLLRRNVHRNVLCNTRPVVGGVGYQITTLRKEPFKPWIGQPLSITACLKCIQLSSNVF